VEQAPRRASVGATRGAGAAERTYLELVRLYQMAILNYIHRLVGDRDAAEDLTQDTYVRAFRALGRLELDEASESRRRAWLYRIAHNVATDHLRRKGRLQWLSLDALRGLGRGDLERSLVDKDPVHAALATLTNEHREVLLLFGVAEMEAAEVAEVLGISEVAARKRRQRARAAFLAAYGADAGGDDGL
jgi:RNA polymerase sigma-70 factor (ECF subfamily)